MKKKLILLAMIIVANIANAQSAYETLMGKKITTSVYVQKSNTQALLDLDNSVDRLTEVNSLGALYTGAILKETIRHNAVVEDQGRFANGMALANTAINLGGFLTGTLMGMGRNFNPGCIFYPSLYGNWFNQSLSWQEYNAINNMRVGIVPSSAMIPPPVPMYVTPSSSWNVFNPFLWRF